MPANRFAKIWVAVTILSFVLESGLGLLTHTSLENNGLMPWRLELGPLGWVMFVAISIAWGLAFTYIFLKGYRGRGLREGVRYGLWITLLASVVPHLSYATLLPEGRRIPLEFIAIDLLTFVVCGAVAAQLAGASASAAAAAGPR